MATLEGPLVLADISGYTKFIAATELEHSDVLVRRMLNTIVASLKERLEIRSSRAMPSSSSARVSLPS